MLIPNILSKILKDPLLHFLLIGIGLFFLFSILNSEEAEMTRPKIIIDKPRLNILTDIFLKDKGRFPSPIEIQTLLENDIKEEILYHEALRLGLDKEDRVIRHRLAQKTKYLFEDVALIDDPSDDELKIFLRNNADKYLNTSGELPAYSELKNKLRRSWLEQAQKKENDDFYADLKSRYEIITSDTLAKDFNKSSI